MVLRGRVVLALALACYAGLLALGSSKPGPRLWGIHLQAYLSEYQRLLVWLSLLAAFVLVGLGTLIGAREITRKTIEPSKSHEAAFPRLLRTNSLSQWRLPIFLGLYGLLLWGFRTRTQFLGDGALWLSRLQTGELLEGHEPLAAALWVGTANALRAAGSDITGDAMAPASVLCGLVAAAIAWGIARELTAGGLLFIWTLVLVATMGSAQLFFGYIESYPPAAVAVLAFLYTGIRSIRRSYSPLLPGIVLAGAIACHLACIYLAPAYVYLMARSGQGIRRMSLHALLVIALTASLLLALGYGPSRMMETLRVATIGVESQASPSIPPHDVRPYPMVSWHHVLDISNEILLVIPVPLLLLCGGLTARRGTTRKAHNPRKVFLCISAASGLTIACFLILPVTPAQDWDLFSLLLIPMGILGIYLGSPLLNGRGGSLVGAGTMIVALSTLASFVLVNADRDAGVRRFEALVGPGAKITPFARTYAHEILVYYHRHLGNRESARRYAEALLRGEPTNPRLWAMVGAIHYSQGDFAGAIPYLEQAIARGRVAAGTWTNLAICYVQVGRQKEALLLFKMAAAKEPDRPDYQVNLALGLFSDGQSDSARSLLLRTILRWPRYEPARHALRRHSPPWVVEP